MPAKTILHENALRKLQMALVMVAVIAFVAASGYRLIEGWSWFESFYMAVTTLATVGYMEIHPLSPAGRLFNILVIVTGVGAVFFSIGALTQTLMEVELERVFGRHRMEREIEKLSGHFIICGAGRVGRSAARELARNNVAFVVIEADEATLEGSTNTNWLTIVGDATQEKTLRQGHVERASGLVAAATTDATNIYIVLTAKSLNPRLKIIARASEEDAEKHLKTSGADVVVSPYSFAGHRIAQSFLRPNVLDFLDIAAGRDRHEEMVIEEVHVDPDSRLAGTTVGTSQIHRELGIMVLAIKRREGPKFNPTANEPISSGDNLIVMGEVAKMKQLERIAAGRDEARAQ